MIYHHRVIAALGYTHNSIRIPDFPRWQSWLPERRCYFRVRGQLNP